MIDEISIRAPEALFEVNGVGATNVGEIRKNADRYQPAASGEGAEKPEKAETEPVRLVIRKFRVERGEIAADTTPDLDLLALEEALVKLTRSFPRKARVVELLYFGGMTGDEAAIDADLGRNGATPRDMG